MARDGMRTASSVCSALPLTLLVVLLLAFGGAPKVDAARSGARMLKQDEPKKDKEASSSIDLLGFTGLAECELSASASLTVTSGSGSVYSGASCEGQAEAVKQISFTVGEWLLAVASDPDTACTPAEIERVAKDIGDDIGSAYAQTSIDIRINGLGSGCANATADPDPLSTLFAKAILREAVLSGMLSPEDDDTLCLTASTAASFASAWSTAKIDGCQEGRGRVARTEQTMVDSAGRVTQRLLAELSLLACGKNLKTLRNHTAELDEAVGADSPVEGDEEDDGIVEAFAVALEVTSKEDLSRCDGGADGSLAVCLEDADAKECKMKRKTGFVWEAQGGGKTCCRVEALLPYV